MILFFHNLGKGEVPSIKKLIEFTDELYRKMKGKKPDLSYKTKYMAIKGLIDEGILTSEKKYGICSISLSKKYEEYCTELLTVILE